MKSFNIITSVIFSIIFNCFSAFSQTSNTPPIPNGETVIGGHLHAGKGNEVWTDATALYFNYRGNASTTHFWNLGGGTGSSIMTLLQNGNVGIGTSSPQTNLHIRYNSGSPTAYLRLESQIVSQNASIQYFSEGIFRWELGTGISTQSSFELFDRINNTARLVVQNNGNVGIGTTTPGTKLDIVGGDIRGDHYLTLQSYPGYGSGMGTIYFCGSLGNFVTNNGITINSGNFLVPNGNIIIGKSSQSNTSYMLDVAGKVRANEVVVNTTGADYVFDSNYKLRKLTDVEQFIKQNKHLPDIAPAKTMQDSGVNVSEMQNKLLQKVEELTLYTIEQNKKIEKQDSKIESIEEQNKLLKQEIELLKQNNSTQKP